MEGGQGVVFIRLEVLREKGLVLGAGGGGERGPGRDRRNQAEGARVMVVGGLCLQLFQLHSHDIMKLDPIEVT
jgi:hypothetical protein